MPISGGPRRGNKLLPVMTPEDGNGNPLQYSCLENPMDRGAWQATVHEVTKIQTQLSDYHLSLTILTPERCFNIMSV